jgi:lipopolysaccharide export system permease protein
LVGCPVGIRASRGDYLSTFVSCFLPIIGLYYPMMICANNLGRQGKLNPILALWTADGLFILVAATLIWRLVRR